MWFKINMPKLVYNISYIWFSSYSSVWLFMKLNIISFTSNSLLLKSLFFVPDQCVESSLPVKKGSPARTVSIKQQPEDHLKQEPEDHLGLCKFLALWLYFFYCWKCCNVTLG